MVHSHHTHPSHQFHHTSSHHLPNSYMSKSIYACYSSPVSILTTQIVTIYHTTHPSLIPMTTTPTITFACTPSPLCNHSKPRKLTIGLPLKYASHSTSSKTGSTKSLPPRCTPHHTLSQHHCITMPHSPITHIPKSVKHFPSCPTLPTLQSDRGLRRRRRGRRG